MGREEQDDLRCPGSTEAEGRRAPLRAATPSGFAARPVRTRSRRTILANAVGHDHEVLERMCDRAILFHEGRVEADGPFAEVLAAYARSG
jgi:hypothetical protein